jgi:hypothetical protein
VTIVGAAMPPGEGPFGPIDEADPPSRRAAELS